jgi:hypothetical protein
VNDLISPGPFLFVGPDKSLKDEELMPEEKAMIRRIRLIGTYVRAFTNASGTADPQIVTKIIERVIAK